jgi:3-hexulose-6-phosphate synthase
MQTPKFGAPLVVIGAPLAVDPGSFRTAEGNVEEILRQICERVHCSGDVPTRRIPQRPAMAVKNMKW